VDISSHIDALDRDGALLADAAEAAGLQAGVPGCPGWQVRDLLRHQAYVHAWAARHVRERSAELLEEAAEADILGGGPADADLIAAYRDGHAALVATLRDADPDVECATFMPAPSPLAFWARRQAHETAVHRYDAQSALPGGPPSPAAAFEAAFAADGVDELIMGFAARQRYLYRGGGAERSLTVRTRDAAGEDSHGPDSHGQDAHGPDSHGQDAHGRDAHGRDAQGRWHVRLADGGTAVSRDDPAADCTLEGTAAGLYAFLWNRADAARAGLTITGRQETLARWNSSVRVRW
jgi:uncharacterized protein (TIGR03083 family)